MDKTEELYFKDLDRHKVITPEEERHLLQLIKLGDKKAVNRLILGNLRFVVSIARRYQGRGLSLSELINEGNLGLFKAAKRFDLEKEVKFISYAVWWIRQTIQKALFEGTGSVRIPPNKLVLINKFRKALSHNNGDYDKTLSSPEFKDSRRDIVEILDKVVEVSLDAPIGSGGDSSDAPSSLLDMLGKDAEQVKDRERAELTKVVDEVLGGLTEREQRVIQMYYGIHYPKEFTLDDIGQELKLTRERVRQIKNKALKKMFRSKETKEKLTPFVAEEDGGPILF